MDGNDYLSLADWRRRVAELYARVRTMDPPESWQLWRAERDDLFKDHFQSPLPQDERESFRGLPYFDHDPALRVTGTFTPASEERYDLPTSGEGPMSFTRFGVIAFDIDDEPQRLEVYWLEGYGGGIFLPFRDATSGTETYGAGRYLFDTAKGADLGTDDKGLVLDFNFAYNPSCSYDPRWVCPLAPPPNRLNVPVRAGERVASSS
jgi:uncharacterized protein